VHEEIIFTGNAGAMNADAPSYEKAVESRRRLGAKVQATNVSAQQPLRWFLSIRGYDLAKAGGNLIGLSNSLALTDGSRAIHVDRIQVALKLPRDSTEDYLRHIVEQKRKSHSGCFAQGGRRVIRIAISPEAFEARIVDRLVALRGEGESYSHVILRLVKAGRRA
jgi:predicted CopG family antitoxin